VDLHYELARLDGRINTLTGKEDCVLVVPVQHAREALPGATLPKRVVPPKLIRAYRRVNSQLMVMCARFVRRLHAFAPRRSRFKSGMRQVPRYWRAKTLISISA
jgi:hypothetical protein